MHLTPSSSQSRDRSSTVPHCVSGTPAVQSIACGAVVNFHPENNLGAKLIMKKFYLSALAASLVLMTVGAQAAQAPTAELRVAGTLDVPPCTVDIEGNGVYDYTDLSPDDINPGTTEKKLDTLTKRLMVLCEGETYLTYSVTDNEPESQSAAGNDKFGLGKVNDKGPIGYYNVRMKNPQVDDNSTTVRGFATAANIVGQNASRDIIVRKDGFVFGWLHPTQIVQQIGRRFEADMEVTAFLAGSGTMGGPITDDVPLHGSMTLNFAYGL